MDSSSALPAPPVQQQEQLSGVAVVIIIAVGVQTFIMLFIFAKRQIMRFTLRGRRGPHVSVGQGKIFFFTFTSVCNVCVGLSVRYICVQH
jgi:hypothetical protein